MGLIGYINDELQRRSKEIAIRKVNGAESFVILEMLVQDVLWISFRLEQSISDIPLTKHYC